MGNRITRTVQWTALAIFGCGSADHTDLELAQSEQELSALPAVLSLASPFWKMAGHDSFGHHNNRLESQINAANAQSLEVEWVFDAEDAGHDVGPIHATPAVTPRGLYVGTNRGRFYAINRDGTFRWEHVARQPNPLLEIIVTPSPVGGEIPNIAGTPVVGGAVVSELHGTVVYADLDGNVYGLDTRTGAERWVHERVDPHPLGGVIGNSLLLVGDTVVVGFASIEDAGLLLPTLGVPYECCSHTGLVVAFDIDTGEEKWRHDTISPDDVQSLPEDLAPFQLGPSGADVWGMPTYDPKTDTIFIGTGQNFSPTPSGTSTGTSDAFIALDADTGAEKWVTQVTAGDIWVEGIPSPGADGRFLDQDIGDSPKIYRLADGRKVVGAGQKSGVYWVLDARTGEIVAGTKHLQQANQLGGFQNGGAFGRGKVFQHGQHGLDQTADGPFVGVVMALSKDGTEEQWRFERPFSIFSAPLAVANDVVYFLSPVEELLPGTAPQQFALYGLHADTGAIVAHHTLDGRAVSGPVVSQGRLYIASGNRAIEPLGVDDTGSIICMGLPDF